jgi:dipeptidyl aminopeptidase/acylaminoacyl peptidase
MRTAKKSRGISAGVQPASLRTLACSLLLLALAPLAGPQAAMAEGLSLDDVLQLRVVTQAALSHDGKLVAYTLSVPRSAEADNGPEWSQLYMISTDGGPSRPFVTGEVEIHDPAFSPDDRYVAFRAKRGDDEHQQVWVIPLDGGEAQRVTGSESDVLFYAWSPLGDRLAYVAAAPKSERRKELEEKGYWPGSFEENLRDRTLYMVPFTFGEVALQAEALTDTVSVWQLAFSPDGQQIALGISDDPLVDQRYMFQRIHLLDLATGERRRIVNNPGKLGNFCFSPDGKQLAYTAAWRREDHAVSNAYVLELETGRFADLTPPYFGGHITSVAWQDAEHVIYLAEESVWTTISRVRPGQDSRKREVLFNAERTGLITDLPRLHPGVRTWAMLGNSPEHPSEVYVWSGQGDLQRLTISNPWLAERELAEQIVVRYAASDGLEIEGILMLPLAYEEDERYPLLVSVHGGPESRVPQGWLSSHFRPGQAAAARGYVVFYPNYRGSTGRGLEFARAAYGDPAGKEFDDIADGIRHLIDEGLADGQRVGISGGSYGGYAAAWFGTYYTALVRAAVTFAGISDLVSKRLLTDIPYEDEYVHMGKPLRESWELMRERSPIAYAHMSRSAILILHGQADPRVSPCQGRELYRALKMSGHPAVRLVTYPDEGHGNRRRFGRWDAAHRLLRWFDWYVMEARPLNGPLPPLDISAQYGLPDDMGAAAEESRTGSISP